MANYSNFVSDSSIKARDEEIKQARKSILEKAQKKYEAEELREKKKKQSGEATWMLDTVSKRIHKEQKTIEASKSKKKKDKKDKKKKKKKKRKQSRSSSSSSSEGNEEETWVETTNANSSKSNQSSGKLQRDSWMEAPLDLIPSVTRQELREEANKEKEKAKREAEKLLEPGQHARELNPYWKDGGTGLPSTQQESSSSSSSSLPSSRGTMGDAGLSWMLKSLSRMKEQAQEEKRSLEDIAAERYGSLDRLMSMIREAERSQRSGRDGTRQERRQYSNDGEDMDRKRDKARDRDSGRHRDRRSVEREEKRNYDRRDRDGFESKKYSNQGSRFKRPGSDDEDGRDSYHRKDKSHRHNNDEDSSSQRSRFQRPGSDDDSGGDGSRSRDRSRQNYNNSSRFRRPDSDDENNRDTMSRPDNGNKSFKKPSEAEDSKRDSYSKSSSSSSSSYTSKHRDEVSTRRKEYDSSRQGRRDGWRKSPDRNNSDVPRWKKMEAQEDGSRKKKELEKKRDKTRRKSSSSSSSSSSDSDNDDDNKNKQISDSEEEPQVQAPPKVLSEAELNALAAKVLRAEIMGDESLASQLKSTLEKARHVRESSKATASDGNEGGKDFVHSMRMEKEARKGGKEKREDGEGDDNVVVLSLTNKSGMVRPVGPSSSSSSTEWGGRSAGKKRKRKNVDTHTEGGERTKFFHDDDNFDLKTLVEREKAGTAEDQNSMFARLAGRETDRDMDVDDMFVNKAAKGRQEEEASNRDKMAAIMEHRKKSSAMEKCTRCFDKVPKHLIIAIGRKSYLCLPDHASLSEGHCFIVPMSHSTSATSLDEDVWQDIQLFRKSLVRMFLSQEKDVVVMETVMHLKHFPHTAIECIPLEQELGDLAPIYFKKAMQEVGPEWSHNKKIHDLSKKDIRHTVPKGFPYFSVDFGLQGGFAHVIEDEATFPSYFGREIVGGMLDAEPGLWRKPRKQNFEDQRQKVLQFEQWWSPFDWTQDIG